MIEGAFYITKFNCLYLRFFLDYELSWNAE